MSKCDLYFDDPTAHKTVEWFLHSLTEEKEIPSEDLCEAFNVVRFIDYLRLQVKNNEEYFKSIESIAKGLESGKWEDCPHLSVLLFSIARDYLLNLFEEHPESVKAKSLYRVAKEIHEYFKKHLKKHPNSPESYSHVFKTGFQLAYFQEDDNWHREYAKFKDRYYGEFSKLRLHYHSVNNPTDFSQRAVERWKRVSIVRKEFEALEREFRSLNPLSLELPIPARSARASEFASKFVRDLEDSKKSENDQENIVTEIAKEFRIVQWEILVRNLVEENRNPVGEDGKYKLHFYPITEDLKVEGIPDEKFLGNFIKEALEIERRFIPSYGEMPTRKRSDRIPTKESFRIPTKESFANSDETLVRKVHERHESFKILLPQIPERYSFVHEDLVKSFANMRQDDTKQRDSYNSPGVDSSSNVMLIEDGEFSFFTLLWLLRYAHSKVKPARNGESNLINRKLAVRFHPGLRADGEKNPIKSDWTPSENDWSTCNIIELAEECGWIIRLSDENCVPTRRWRSLIIWLRRLNDDLRKTYETDQKCFENIEELKNTDTLIKRLPVKRLDYDQKRTSFIKTLWKFLASSDLEELLDNELDTFSSAPFVRYTEFVKNIERLIKSLDNASLLTVESSAGLDDTILLRCCQGFIPLEYLFRAYQPYELHWLLQALNWEKSPAIDGNQGPISLGAATIAGRVETSQDLMPDSTISPFDHWLVPYRSLFSTLSADVSLPAVKESSEQIGERTGAQVQQTEFVHQTMGLLDMPWVDPKINELDSRSRFALWSAREQVASIWGNFPIDTTEGIDQIFSEWQGVDKSKIINELINIGIYGGITRAARAPKDSSTKNPEWRVTNYAESLLIIDPEKAVSKVHSDLSFKPPETVPPDWVTTKAFVLCFYHGMRQAVYHALKTFVLIDCKLVKSGKPCLWIEWNTQSVLIHNRGKDVPKHFKESQDRAFFDRFVEKTNEFHEQKKIDERFEINGPEPTNDSGSTWQLEIRKEKSDEF